jgi:mono/diheme cytochrome c family protein
MPRPRHRPVRCYSFAVVAGITVVLSGTLAAAPAAATAGEASGAIAKYCGTCHSPAQKMGGLTLDPATLKDVSARAEQWEKVIRKLRSQSMPPPGMPRPDTATYAKLLSYLEGELDHGAAVKMSAGKVPLLRRLTRTEYQNAVRDVLALDSLPKEMEYAFLLPPDNSSSGFDNIADLLFVSPTSMESYLSAAEKVSRLALGDTSAPPMVNIYRLPDEAPQTERVDGMPFGTRGGFGVRSYFPLDGEYLFKVVLVGSSPNPQQLEISVDGEPVQLTSLAAASRGRGGRGGAPPELKPVRIPVKAGPRNVAVTFIQPNEARDEEVLRPRLRGTGPEVAIETVTVTGPVKIDGPGDTPSRRRILICRPSTPPEEEPCARRILSTLVRRAYRRPATPADMQTLMPFFISGRAESGFETGIGRALQRLLVSPQFLFRVERDPPGTPPGTVHRVTDLELASRLSFFIWSSIPDDELLQLAIEGKLQQPGIVQEQVRRMLADRRASSLVTNFAEQWLFLRDLESKKPNEILFPDFDESLRAAFHKETSLFLDSVLRGNRSVLELLSANYTFVNERLAKHYGIPNVHGTDFRRVELPAGSPRGGLLGQGSLLTITSYANRTSPVNRGKWVLENLLSAGPPPPPPNVPALKTEGTGEKNAGKTLSMREAMVQHRASPACFSCHARMDPIGFAMENFDPVGRWRDRDAGQPIDTAGVFPDGVKFEGMAGLKQALLSHPEEFLSTMAEKLLMYGIGRNVQYFDQPVLRAIVKKSALENNTFASLVQAVAASAPFTTRETQPARAGTDSASRQK